MVNPPCPLGASRFHSELLKCLSDGPQLPLFWGGTTVERVQSHQEVISLGKRKTEMKAFIRHCITCSISPFYGGTSLSSSPHNCLSMKLLLKAQKRKKSEEKHMKCLSWHKLSSSLVSVSWTFFVSSRVFSFSMYYLYTCHSLSLLFCLSFLTLDFQDYNVVHFLPG